MGLAASQGRMLCLTSRKNDLIYEAQQISQQRLALADQQSAIAEEYTKAMNNTVMQAIMPDGSAQTLTFDILTSQDAFAGLGMRIVDAHGNVVVPGGDPSITVDDGENSKTYTVLDIDEFIDTHMQGLSEEERTNVGKMNLSGIFKYYSDNFAKNNEKLSVSYKANEYEHLRKGGESFSYDEFITDPEYLQRMLTTGEYTIEKQNTDSKGNTVFESLMWQGSNQIREVFDTSDDAAAEAEYEKAMADTQKKDKLLELRLEQVQTEEKAVETELDSVKDVINKNVEGSFKTFA